MLPRTFSEENHFAALSAMQINQSRSHDSSMDLAVRTVWISHEDDHQRFTRWSSNASSSLIGVLKSPLTVLLFYHSMPFLLMGMAT